MPKRNPRKRYVLLDIFKWVVYITDTDLSYHETSSNDIQMIAAWNSRNLIMILPYPPLGSLNYDRYGSLKLFKYNHSFSFLFFMSRLAFPWTLGLHIFEVCNIFQLHNMLFVWGFQVSKTNISLPNDLRALETSFKFEDFSAKPLAWLDKNMSSW